MSGLQLAEEEDECFMFTDEGMGEEAQAPAPPPAHERPAPVNQMAQKPNVADEEEDECCEMSAGRTQRGSFSSLLLLEAQELFDTMETMDTMENSPEDEVIESADRVAVAATN